VADFRFKVRIASGNGSPRAGAQEPVCIAETLCVSGAVSGRAEVFLRVVGPKPNGRLWPTLVKFSTSRVEVWVLQMSSGLVRYYDLAGAAPGVDTLPGLFDREGFVPASAASAPDLLLVPGASQATDPPPGPGEWLTSPHFPGFRFRVEIGDRQAQVETECIPETVCLSGAVAGRAELFLRLVGPKPNGYLWATLVKFTTSAVEVWIEQVGTGRQRHYRLEGASPGNDALNGLFDRTAFLP
jgi:hypothetical protein